MAGEGHPEDSQLMLAYTRNDVHSLNTRARELLQAEGELGKGEVISSPTHACVFGVGSLSIPPQT
jgi:hypothetical protein